MKSDWSEQSPPADARPNGYLRTFNTDRFKPAAPNPTAGFASRAYHRSFSEGRPGYFDERSGNALREWSSPADNSANVLAASGFKVLRLS